MSLKPDTHEKSDCSVYIAMSCLKKLLEVETFSNQGDRLE
jgi:hypothetical protein